MLIDGIVRDAGAGCPCGSEPPSAMATPVGSDVITRVSEGV